MKDGDASTTFYYCYIYRKLNKKQELPIVFSGRSTALTYLVEDHNMDKATGLLRDRSESIPTQPIIRATVRAKMRTLTPPLRRLR